VKRNTNNYIFSYYNMPLQWIKLNKRDLLYDDNKIRNSIITYSMFEGYLNEESELIEKLQVIYNKVIGYYPTHLQWSNVCIGNVMYVCHNLRVDDVETGQIIIRKNTKQIKNILDIQQIQLIYGDNGSHALDADIHILVYLQLHFEGEVRYVAIETIIENPYKLQFYVASTEEILVNIIKARYNVVENHNNFIIPAINDCRAWNEIVYPTTGGNHKKSKGLKTGKRKRQTKRRNKKSKKKIQQRTQRNRR
jgi:hypothetical protein